MTTDYLTVLKSLCGAARLTLAMFLTAAMLLTGIRAQGQLADDASRTAANVIAQPSATLTVTKTADTNDGVCNADCSLREAIAAAASGDTINFASPLFDSAQTITLAASEILIDKSLTIRGTGARRLTVDASNSSPAMQFAVFSIKSDTSSLAVNISGITITGGYTGGVNSLIGVFNDVTLENVNISRNLPGDVGGGGINNGIGNKMTILNSLISSNTGRRSGGIENNGLLIIANTTISDNTASETNSALAGGGINNLEGNTVNLNNVTIANNRSNTSNTNSTGGIYNEDRGSGDPGIVNIRNTIITGNTAVGGTSEDVNGAFNSNGNNLVGTLSGSTGFSSTNETGAAMLGALANNGGQTNTRVPATTSRAINAGNNCVVNLSCGTNNPPVALVTDQRGSTFSRQIGTVDIGALERQQPTAAGVSISGRVLTPEGRGLTNASVTLTDFNGNTRTTRTSSFGYYRFEEVAAGQTYIIAVSSKRYEFAPQIATLTEDVTDLNFFADPPPNGVFIK